MDEQHAPKIEINFAVGLSHPNVTSYSLLFILCIQIISIVLIYVCFFIVLFLSVYVQ